MHMYDKKNTMPQDEQECMPHDTGSQKKLNYDGSGKQCPIVCRRVCSGKQNTGLQGFSRFKMRIRDDISLTERKAVDLK